MTNTAPRTKDNRAKLRRALMALPVMTMAAVTAMTAARPGADASVPASSAREGRIVLYVHDNAELEAALATAHKADQVNYAFALIEDGRATLDHAAGLKHMTRFLRENPHIDGVLSVGGWAADGFSQACATAEGREALADSILQLMDAHGFVGVDIDWEYPGIPAGGIAASPDDAENWYALLALLREGLDARQEATGRDHLLSVALGAAPEHVGAADGARIAEYVDQAVVMAYDLCGFDRITGHHAGLYPEQAPRGSGAYAVKRLTEGGMDPQRILLGIPAYGRVWRQVAGEGNGLAQRAGTSGNKTIAFDEVLRLTERGYTKRYDETAEAAWWFDGSSFVSAEDDRSIQAKCDWLIAKGLQGAAVWQYSQDQSGAMLAMLNAAMME